MFYLPVKFLKSFENFYILVYFYLQRQSRSYFITPHTPRRIQNPNQIPNEEIFAKIVIA